MNTSLFSSFHCLFVLMNVLFRNANGIQNKRLLLNTMAHRFICIDRATFTNNSVRIGVVDVAVIFHIGNIQGKISVLAFRIPEQFFFVCKNRASKSLESEILLKD